MQSSLRSLLAFLAAGTSMSNQATAGDEAVVEENLTAAAEAASKGGHHLAEGMRHKEDIVVPSDEARAERSGHAEEYAETLGGKVRRRKIVDVREARQPCGQRARSPGRAGGRFAAESICGTDTGEIDDGTGGQWLTQQQAGEEFCLSLQTLRSAANEGLLKVEKRPNPYGATYAPMRLYQRSELRRLAFQVWGDETGVEKERERRREQRWQQRQQRTSSVLCESARLAAGSIDAGAKPRRSLPDLRTFLRSSSKKKRERMQHSTGGSLRRVTASRPVGRETSEKLSTFQTQRGRRAASGGQYSAAEKVSAVTGASVVSEEASYAREEAGAQNQCGDIRGHAHSVYSREIEWEEI